MKHIKTVDEMSSNQVCQNVQLKLNTQNTQRASNTSNNNADDDDDFVVLEPMINQEMTSQKEVIFIDKPKETKKLSVNQINSMTKLKLALFSSITDPVNMMNFLIYKLKTTHNSNHPLADTTETIMQIREHMDKHYPDSSVEKLADKVVDDLMSALSFNLTAFWKHSNCWNEEGHFWYQVYKADVLVADMHGKRFSPMEAFISAFGKLMSCFNNLSESLLTVSCGDGVSELIRALLPFAIMNSSPFKFRHRQCCILQNLSYVTCENVLEHLSNGIFNITELIEVAFSLFEVIESQDAREVNFLAPKFSCFYPDDDEVKDQMLAVLSNTIKVWTKLLHKKKVDEGHLLLKCHQAMVAYEDKSDLFKKSFYSLSTAKTIVEAILKYRCEEIWLDMKPVFGAALSQNENVDFRSLLIVKYIEFFGCPYPNVNCNVTETKIAAKKVVNPKTNEKEELKRKMMLALGLLKD